MKFTYLFAVPILVSLGSILLSISNVYPVDGQTIPANMTALNSTESVTDATSSNQTNQYNQTTTTANLTSPSLSDPLFNEKLLNYTNNAILALNDDNETEIQRNLVQIQNELIKAIGKPVVIVPAPALTGSGSD